MPTRRRPRKGKGFMDILGKVGNFLKDTKLISTVSGLIPHPAGQAISGVAGSLGLGRKRRVRRGRALPRADAPRKPKTLKGKGFLDLIPSLLGKLFGGKRERVPRGIKLF